MTRCAPAFSNATPPTVRTALTISRPHNCGAVLGRTCNRIDREPNSPLRAGAYWSVYELTHRAPGSRRAAGSRSARTECPRICWHTILYLWETTVVRQAIETARASVSSGAHSSSYWTHRRHRGRLKGQELGR